MEKEEMDLNQTKAKSKPFHGCLKDPPHAWFTLLMVFLVNFLLGINWIAFSVFYIHFADTFQASKAVTGWIGSIQVGANQLFGKFEL